MRPAIGWECQHCHSATTRKVFSSGWMTRFLNLCAETQPCADASFNWCKAWSSVCLPGHKLWPNRSKMSLRVPSFNRSTSLWMLWTAKCLMAYIPSTCTNQPPKEKTCLGIFIWHNLFWESLSFTSWLKRRLLLSRPVWCMQVVNLMAKNCSGWWCVNIISFNSLFRQQQLLLLKMTRLWLWSCQMRV